jgi:hypothetical protein
MTSAYPTGAKPTSNFRGVCFVNPINPESQIVSLKFKVASFA